MPSIEGDPMICANPRDMILYARSSYYYNNMFIICLFPTYFSDFINCFRLYQEKCGNVCHYITFHDVTSSSFSLLVPCLKFTLRNIATKTGNRG